jgi:glycosyl hydrolase family 26
LLVLCAPVAGLRAPTAGAGHLARAVSATPAPIGVFPGSAATRSVLRFEHTLGRPVDYGHDYIHKSTWRSITNVRWLARSWTAAGFAGRTVITVPMLPDHGGSMAAGAEGKYNPRFRRLARQLVAGGQGAAVLRIGPEFNGDWFRWTIRGRGGSARYKAYWREIVDTVRGVPGANFRFDWSPNGGSSWVGSRRLRASTAYPGDAYVDYIGLDVFDQSWARHSRSASKRWQEFLTQTDGLNWHARFAAAHGKPMTFPEWGLVKRRDGRGGGDNPYFVDQMYDWIQTHPVAYHLYFESRDPNGDYRVFSGRFPRAARSFIADFGVQKSLPGL